MSRSGYSDAYFDENNYANLYRWTVVRAIKGKRGQAFLREMAEALDAMPVKELVTDVLVDEDGAACAIGAVARRRGQDVSKLDPENGDAVGKAFGISRTLACEIVYENDENGRSTREDGRWRDETPAERWTRMRRWVAEQLGEAT